MLLNISNHPSKYWTEHQMETAINLFGQVQDIPFPFIPPNSTTKTIVDMATSLADNIIPLNPKGVHIMGEFTFCLTLVVLLQKKGIMCIASTTYRNTIDNPDGTKTIAFKFEQFREYPNLLNN